MNSKVTVGLVVAVNRAKVESCKIQNPVLEMKKTREGTVLNGSLSRVEVEALLCSAGLLGFLLRCSHQLGNGHSRFKSRMRSTAYFSGELLKPELSGHRDSLAWFDGINYQVGSVVPSIEMENQKVL